MTRAFLIACLLLPSAAAAQTTFVSLESAAEPGANEGRLTISLPDAATALSVQPRAAQAPAPAPERRRRRPSMVGYVNDAGIQSQVRLRFDAGVGVNSADRAEFFYPKCGCYRGLPVGHPARDLDARGPGPGILTDMNFQQFYAQAEFAIRDRISFFGELPVRWIQPQAFLPDSGSFDNQGGLSDVRAGVKLALVASDAQYVTVQLQGNFPTGDGLKGLGVEHFSFEPALLYSQAVGDRMNIEGQFGFVFATDGSNGIATTSEKFSGNVLYYGIGPSLELYRSDTLRFAPVVELVAWRVLGGYQTSTFTEADGVNIVNLKIGGRFEFRGRSSIYIGYGHALTDKVWYDDLFRVEYRYTF